MEYPYVNFHTHNEECEAITTNAVGIHPWDAEEHDLSQDESRRWLEAEILSAEIVGEIGLDYAAEVDRRAQMELFVAQLKLAKKHRKPVLLHSVRAFEATMQTLSTFPIRAVVFHGFIGSAQQMNEAADKGYYFSFGERTFTSPKTVKALRECPAERLLFETDTSNVAIAGIYERAAKYRIESVDELLEIVYNNYKKVING